MNSYSYFAEGFATRRDKVFLEDAGRAFTFADLDRETARYAAFFQGLGQIGRAHV